MTTADSIHCDYADAVYRDFMSRRYGVQPCPDGKNLAFAEMDEQLAEFKEQGGEASCCDINDLIS